MADSALLTIDLPAVVDLRLATQTFARGADTVHREEVVIGNTGTNAALAAVLDADPAGTDYGLVVRPLVETAAGALFVKLTDGTDTALVSASGELSVSVAAFPDNEPFNLNQLGGTALAVPFDVDSGAGTQNVAGVSIRKAASGGSVEYGTSTDPLRIDPTGTTTQPISIAATVTVDSELPAAAALADGAANPTTPLVGSAALLFNGTTWDRARGDTTNGLDTDVTRVIPGTTATALGKAEDAAHASADTGVYALAVRDDALAAHSGADGDYESFHTDATGRLYVRTAAEGGQGATVPVYASHIPAVNTQATINRAAGAAGVRNVCLGFTVSITAGSAAPTAAVPIVANLIDGISGGTTYLWRGNLGIPTTAGVTQGYVVDGWFEGTQATQLTLETSAAGGANTFVAVTLRTIQVAE